MYELLLTLDKGNRDFMVCFVFLEIPTSYKYTNSTQNKNDCDETMLQERHLSKMKMYIYIKPVLCKCFLEGFLQRSFVHAKLEIDNRFRGDNSDNVSKKCHR